MRSSVVVWVRMAVLALVYWAAGRWALEMPYYGASIALIWFPAGIAIAALVVWGRRVWPGVFIGGFLVNYSHGPTLWVSLGIATGNAVGALIGFWLLERFSFNREFRKGHDIALLTMAGGVGSAVSALNGTLALTLSGALQPETYQTGLLSWWAGDMIGLVVAAPACLTMTRSALKEALDNGREFGLWLMLITAVSASVFLSQAGLGAEALPMSFVPLFLVVWSSLRLGWAGTTLGVLVVSIFAALGTSMSSGPFRANSEQEALIQTWVYIVLVAGLGWLITSIQRARGIASERLEEARQGLKMGAEALRKSEEQFRALTESSPDYIARYDLDGRHLYANPALISATGLPAEQVLGHTHEEMGIPPSICKIWLDNIREAAETKQVIEFEFRGQSPFRVIESKLLPETNEGGRVRTVIGVARDITKRKQVEEELRLSEERLALVLRGSRDAAWDWDLIESRLYYAPRWYSMLGYDPADASEDPLLWQRRAHPDDVERVVETYSGAIDKGRDGFEVEFRLLHADGHYVPILSRGYILRDSSGQAIRMSGTNTDLTERKRTEEAVLQIAQGVSASTGEDFFRSLTEHLVTTLHADFAFVGELDPIEPDYVQIVASHSDRGEAIGTGYHLEGTPCSGVVGKEPCIFPAEVSSTFPHAPMLSVLGIEGYIGTPLLDADGGPLGLLVLMYRHPIEDPTLIQSTLQIFATRASGEIERRRASEVVKKNEERLRSLIETALDAVIAINSEGRIIEWNAVAEAIFGYSREEVLGENLAEIIVPPSLRESHRRGLARYLETGRSTILGQRIELTAMRSDGTEFPVEIAITPTRDGDDVLFNAFLRDVTARKKADEVLRLSELRYRNLIDSAPEAIFVIDFDTGQVVDHNPQAERLFKLSSEELKHCSPVDLSPPRQPCGRESREKAFEYIKSAAEGEMPTFEWVHIDGDGREFPCEIRLQRMPGPSGVYVRGSIVDITERKEAEIALEQSERRFRMAVETMTLVGVMLDREARITLANQFLLDLTGWKREEVLGRDWFEVFLPEDVRPSVRKIFEAAIHSTNFMAHYENEIVTRTGERRLIAWNNVAIRDAEGEVTGVTSIGEDITERTQLQAQLLQSQKMEAMGTLAGGIAHDFNNILGAILGNIELAGEDIGPGHPAQESLQEIRKASHRGRDLVQQILTFSRQRAQQDRKVIQLGPIVGETVRLMRAAVPAGTELNSLIDPDAPNVLADSSQVQQVLLNLATNAWQALEGAAGEVRIDLERTEVRLPITARLGKIEPGIYAMITVSDTGKSMNSQTLARIFDPFFTTKSPGEGTGLGLSVVHSIIKSHGGAVLVESEPGLGTRFKLYFAATELPLDSAPDEVANVPLGGGQHILYVDDEEALVLVVNKMLTRMGYVMSGFTRPEEALEFYRQQASRIDLVVTDYSMPRMSGLDFARKALEVNADAAVILTSGYVTDKLVQDAEAIGIKQVMYKANTVEEICEIVHRYVCEELTTQP